MAWYRDDQGNLASTDTFSAVNRNTTPEPQVNWSGANVPNSDTGGGEAWTGAMYQPMNPVGAAGYTNTPNGYMSQWASTAYNSPTGAGAGTQANAQPAAKANYQYYTAPDAKTQEMIAAAGKTWEVVPNPALAGTQSTSQYQVNVPYGYQSNPQGSGPLGQYGMNPLYYSDPASAAAMAQKLGMGLTSGSPIPMSQGSPFTSPDAPLLQGANGLANPSFVTHYLNAFQNGAMGRDVVNQQIYRELNNTTGNQANVPDYVGMLTGAPSSLQFATPPSMLNGNPQEAPGYSYMPNVPVGSGSNVLAQMQNGTIPSQGIQTNSAAQMPAQVAQSTTPSINTNDLLSLLSAFQPFSFSDQIAALYGANPLSVLGSYGNSVAGMGSNSSMSSIAQLYNAIRAAMNPTFAGSGVRSPLFWGNSQSGNSVPQSSYYPYFA